MPACRFLNCHNLADSKWSGYCSEAHAKRADEYRVLWSILEKHTHLSTLRDAKQFLRAQTLLRTETHSNPNST
jgi:hypothetical protein